MTDKPTDEEMRLIRIGWDAAHGSKGGQYAAAIRSRLEGKP